MFHLWKQEKKTREKKTQDINTKADSTEEKQKDAGTISENTGNTRSGKNK